MGEFFARVTFRVIHKGMTPKEAIEDVAKSSSKFIKDKVKQALTKAAEAMDPSSPLSKQEFVDDLAITSMARLWDVGKTEPIKVGKANSAVGGDNASRSIPIGMVMGAAQGMEGIPKELGKGHLVEWDHSMKLLDKLPLIKKSGKGGEL